MDCFPKIHKSMKRVSGPFLEGEEWNVHSREVREAC
jgi:hypothetical protein